MAFDDLVGTTRIPLSTTTMNGKTSSSYNMTYKGKSAGSVYIDMEFYSHANLGIAKPTTAPY